MSYIVAVWQFLQDQVLGMRWLSVAISELLSGAGVDLSSPIGGGLHFFIYDVIKITILLCTLIFLISYVQTYFPPERSRRILSRFSGLWANVVGALLGTVTPFCSCSSIPIFMGFTSAGLPLGVTFSFLISSPMVDLGSLLLLTSIFGLKIAFFYVISGLLVAIVGGLLIERLKLENEVKLPVPDTASLIAEERPAPDWKDRCESAYAVAKGTLFYVFPYILAGVGIGALIHNWIPGRFVESLLGADNHYGVILATLVGVPVYADIFGVIPIAEALLAKGAMIGTVLAFMMGVTTLSFPSLLMLRKAIKPKLFWIFIAITVAGIILTGYVFNIFSYLFV